MNTAIKIVIGVIVSIAVIIVPLVVPSEIHAYFIALAGVWIIFAVGFDFAFGVAGLLSFGHAAFFGVGGYFVGILTINHGFGFFPSLALAAAGGALLALAFVAVSLRASGIFFAIFTLILAQLILILLSVKLRGLTGGIDGLAGVLRPEFFGIDMWSNWNYAALVMGFVVILAWLSALLRASPFGQVLSAIRQEPVRSRQIGYNNHLYSASAFMISGAYSAVAGGLNASLISFIGPEALHASVSLDVMIATLIGGMGTTIGPIIGAVLIQGMYSLLSKDSVIAQLIFGLILVLVAIYMPKGLWGTLKRRVFQFGGSRK